jgi:2-oxoglutarate ferredoxin oxidoreductase subunit beta
MAATVETEAAQAPAKTAKENRIGLLLADYKGAESTLCAGCGHDAITASIVKAFHELGVDPTQVAKLSGIGCSSKTPNYFMNQAHGFNAVHGRMAAIATGAALANRNMINIGVSGDGDTASIGLGNFLHMVRRNVPMVYIVENNGCYGLTKGQFSATADKGSIKKGGKRTNRSTPVDICALAIQMGCGFVARSFSGDTNQVKALIEAALSHNGTAVLDVVSPCVTFNNHEGSTKSVAYARQHEEELHEIDFIPHYDPILVHYQPGETTNVKMHDGSMVTLKKLDRDYDPRDRNAAMELLYEAQVEQHFYTGLIYCEPNGHSFIEDMGLVDEPLATLPESRVRPSNAVFEKLMATFK